MKIERLHFMIDINAPREKVWTALWDDAHYREWTAAFTPGSKVETDWNEGSKVLFLDNSDNGMISRIAKKIPNEYMEFKHYGEVNNGIEDTTSDNVKQWAGAEETYTLTEKNGGTELGVKVDTTPDHRDYFEKTWPDALEKLKQLAERL